MKNILVKHFRQLNPLTQGLLIFAICNLVLNLVLKTFSSGGGGETVIQHTLTFLKFSAKFSEPHMNDSWEPMVKALDYLHSSHENLIYSQVFFNEKVKFQYPLTSLLPLFLIEQFPSYHHAQIYLLNFLSWLAISTTVIFAIRIFNLSSNIFLTKRSSEIPMVEGTIRTFLLLILCLTFYPLIKAYTLGQIQVFINCFFTLSVWFWLKRQEHISGIFVGLMLLIKPQYLFIAVWGLLRKKYSFVITLCIVLLIGLLCSVVLFGISNNLNYLSVLKFISHTGEGYYPNQSINGLLNRLLFNGNNLGWERDAFPPFNLIVYAGTLLSSSLLILGALISFVRRNLRGGVIDFMMITLSCTIASPIAWEHHYGILLAIFAFLLPYLLSQPIFGRLTMLLFGLSYILASNFLNILNRSANVPILNTLQSYLLIAALTVLVFLYAIAARRGQTDDLTA